MPETRNIGTLEIKYKGLFNWEELLSTIRKWLGKNYFKFKEVKHKYRPDEREVEIQATVKKTEYVRFNMTVMLFVIQGKEVEVIKDGEKQKMDEGKLIVNIFGEVVLDWQSKYSGRFWERLQKFYHQYIIKQKIKQEWDVEMDEFMRDLQKTVKETVKMEAVA